MYITTDDSFVPKSFILDTFYGEYTCFCWNDDKLSIFPYTADSPVSIDVLTAPAPIKNIQCFEGRIFVICIPQGIYKLSREREFAVLSKSAIGMGTVFYEVLTIRNKYLYLDNKQLMTSKLLLQLSLEESNLTNLCIYPMNSKSATEQFIRAITNKDSIVENLCVIAVGKRVLILANESVQIIYDSIYSIRDIVPVYRNSKIDGLLLITATDVVIVIHSKNDTLTFEKISLQTNVQAICASFSLLTEDTLLLLYSDEYKLYCGKKLLLTDNILRIKIQDQNFACLQYYDFETILGLTLDKQLVAFSTDVVEKTLSVENDTFIDLNADMLKNTDLVMDKIYKGTQTLHRLNEELIREEDKLRRINLYAHKHKVRFCPKFTIHRIANKSFLSANFDNILPKNSWIILKLTFECQNIYCMKKVVDQETIVDIHIPEGKSVNVMQVAIDLITLKDEGYSWCLIKNYVTQPVPEKNKRKTRSEKTNFINSKIAAIQNLIKEGNIDMRKLSEIKKTVRKQFGE
ncbi:uncharacterized protein LOC128875435 [Hylaeus volcanicus]|uniref:uncharacterized protein LOC128875435 n=1 Tax=Hylaeus volcanicus TaxID=313075 RepID=UPI0023B83C5D|nr:uncharacterized protein LOC128875435 [Hylaeus volcanicus]